MRPNRFGVMPTAAANSSINLRWLPVQGYSPIDQGFGPWIERLILPSIALGLAYVALIARITRTSMLEVLAEGYIRDPFDLCDTAEMMGRPASLGAMGVHYFRPDLLGITAPPAPRVNGVGTHTDFRTPSILIYEPKDDDSFELVAVENLVFIRSWREKGQSVPPTFHGVPYDLMTDDPATATDEAHMFEPHFDRHVWIYRDNPNGMFAPFNPAVSCAHHRGARTHPTAH